MRILVLCTHNSVRSQMAEAIFRHLGAGRVEVNSAGSDPYGVNPFVYKVLGEIGVNTQGLSSKSLTQFLDEKFDYVITVCDKMRRLCPVFPGEYKKIHWSINDPGEEKGTEEEIVTAFRKTRNILKALIIDFLNISLDKAQLKCPSCGSVEEVELVEGRCLAFDKCGHCGKVFSAPQGSCCVVCGYSDKVCGEFLREVREMHRDELTEKKEA